MSQLTKEQQITAFLYDVKIDPRQEDTKEIDGAIVQIIELGLATYDPLKDQLEITQEGRDYLESWEF